MCQRFSMCKPIHTYVFAVRCIIFRRILLYLSEKPTKGFPKFFWWQEPHDGCTTPATAFALVHNSRLQECKELDSNSREKGEKCPSIHGQTTFPKPRLSAWHLKNEDSKGLIQLIISSKTKFSFVHTRFLEEKGKLLNFASIKWSGWWTVWFET